MKFGRSHFFAVACLLAALPGCTPAPSDPAPTQAAAPVKVEPATALRRQQTLSAFGTVEIEPDHSRTISLPYDCVVVALRAAAGQTVRAGAPLLDIRPTPAAALEQRRGAEALRFARSESERVRRLRAENLATNADVAAARQALAVAQATVAELGPPIGPNGAYTILAPIAGLVVSLTGEPGGVLSAGSPLVRVGDAHHLQARLGVEIEDLVNLREGGTVAVSDLQGGKTVQGRVTRILRRVDPTTRLAELTVALPSTAQFLPGAAVRAQVSIGEMREVITVPRAALVYSGDAPNVFVAQGGVAQRVPVTLGDEFDNRAEVLSGLDIGTSVIVDGAATLEDGARVTIQTATRP